MIRQYLEIAVYSTALNFYFQQLSAAWAETWALVLGPLPVALNEQDDRSYSHHFHRERSRRRFNR